MDTPHDVTLGAQVQDAPVAVDSVAPPAPPAPAPTPPVVPTSAALVGSVSNASARKFGSTWELKYAISVTERDIATGSPVRAKCLMCEAFDKEVQVGAKRKRTSRIRVFTAPWRPDNMKRHMEQQHPSRWSDYLKLGDNDKCVFFSNPRPLREDSTQPSSAGDVGSVPSDLTPPSSVTAVAGQFRSFLVDKNIVEDLIGDILFGAAGGERRNAWNVPVTFILQEDESLGLDNTGDPNTNRLQPGVDSNESRYIAHVSSLLEFNTCLKYVSMGVSFPQVVSLFQQTAEQTGMDASMNSARFTQQQLTILCRVACAVNFQTLKDALRGVWAFAIALERGNGAGSPYLDVRVRFERDGQLHDYHLVAVPIREEMPQASEHQTEVVVKCLDVVAPAWKTQLIGISTNGSTSKMTSCTRALVSRFTNECVASIFCDWGAVEQFEHVLQEAFDTLCSKRFMSVLTTLIGHLRRQRALISEMNGDMCPKFEEGQWRSIAKALKWISEKRARLIKFIKEAQVACAPGMEWWITVLAVNNIMDRVSLTLSQLRGPITQTSLRREDYLAKLVTDLAEMTGATGPLTASPLAQGNYEHEGFLLTPNATLSFLKEQGSFAIETVDYLLKDFPVCCQAAVDSTAHFVLPIIAQTYHIIADNNENNKTTSNSSTRMPLRTSTPPFLPQVLCKMRNHEFVTEVQLQRVRLLQRFTVDQIEQIEDQHRSLRTAYQLEDHVSQQLHALPPTASFSEAWKDGRFGAKDCQILRSFCGAIASATADPHVLNTATEAEFSLINWRRSPFGLSLIDFSLEAILHAQQYCALSRLRE